jgi:arylsulfatase A-like enzyme
MQFAPCMTRRGTEQLQMTVDPSRPIGTQEPQSLAAELSFITLAAILTGILEAILITTHRVAGVDPFHYVPLQIWVLVPLVWLAITAILAVPSYLLSRRRGAHIVVCAIAATFAGCRIAMVSRKWGLCALIAIFFAALWITRRVRLPAGRWTVAVMTSILLAIACVGVAIPRRSRHAATAAAAGPNVLIIVADTLRHDAVFQPDGSVKPELPSLRRFAGESTIFDAAYAASSWTLPSHFAAVTGLQAHELGLDFDHQSFGKSALTLAERFHRNGYRTAAVIANPFLSEGSGFGRGFDSYEHAAREMDVCRAAPLTILAQVWPRFQGNFCWWSARQVTRRALRQMNDGAAPYFLVLNLMDAHEPSYLEPDCRAGVPARHNTIRTLQVREEPIYHAAIRCLDRSLSALFGRAADSRRGTVVVFLSDHGDHLGERGLIGHGQSLYPELLHVPLMVRDLNRVSRHIATPVSLTDLTSIVTSGDFAPLPERAITSTLVTHKGRRRMISVIRWPWQLITSEPGKEELIDLRTAATVKASPLLAQLRADTAAVQRSWPRLPETDFRSVGYIH